MYEVIFDRNGAKARIHEFFLREKSAERGFMKSSSHSSTASGSYEHFPPTPWFVHRGDAKAPLQYFERGLKFPLFCTQ
jgi:hypothetical protein